MGCSNKTTSTTRTVWTAAVDTHPSNIPFTVVHTNEVKEVRASFLIQSATGTVFVRRVVQYSDDGITWDSWTPFGPAATSTTDVWHYGDAYESLDASKQYARIGVSATHPDTGDIDYANVTLTLDMREA